MALTSQDYPKLQQILGLLRRRFYLVRFFNAVLAILSILLSGLLLAFLWHFLWGENIWASLTYLFMILSFSGLLFWIYWFEPFRIRLHDEALALALERHFPTLDSRLISAIQFKNRNIDVSAELREALIHQTTQTLSKIHYQAIVPWHTPAKMAVIVLIAGSLVFIGERVWPGRLKNAFTSLVFQQGLKEKVASFRSTRFQKSDWSVGDIRLNYRYPTYSGLSPKVVDNTDGTIEGIKGTVVRITATSSSKLTEARIELHSGPTVSMTLSRGGREMQGEFTLTTQDTYDFAVSLDPGGARKSTRRYSIAVKVDLEPKVLIIEPAQDLSIQEAGNLEIQYQLSDDYGLSELQLRVVKEGKEMAWKDGKKELTIKRFGKREQEESGSYSWNLRDLELKPGEEVQFFLRLYDNDTVSGPKFSDSAFRRINILSKEKVRQELFAKEEQVFEELVHSLGDSLEFEPVNDAQLNKKSGEAFRLRLESQLAGLQAITKTLAQNRDEKSNREALHLQGLLGLEKNLENLASLFANSVSANEEWTKRFRKSSEELEKAVLVLERLLYGHKMDALLRDSEQMMENFSNLKKLLDETKDLSAAKKALEEFEKNYAEYLQKMAKAQNATPVEEFYNQDALKELQKESIPGALERIRKMLENGDFEGAKKEMAKLEKEFSKNLAEVKSSGEKMQQQLAGKLQEAVKKLDEVISGQQKLLQESEVLEDKFRKKALEEQRRSYEAFLKKQLVRLDAVRRHQQEYRKNFLAHSKTSKLWGDGLHESLKETLQELENNLRSEDAESALQQVNQSLGLLERMRANTEAIHRFTRLGEHDAQKAMKPLDESQNETEAIASDLGKLLSQNSLKPSGPEKNKISQLRQAQTGIRKRGLEVADGVEKLAKDLPFLNKDFFGDEKGEERMAEMKEAAKKLSQYDVPGSVPLQRSGLFKLQKAREQIQDALEQAKASGGSGQGMMFLPGGGRQQGGDGSAVNQERVRIPGADAYRVPEDFRKEIMDAMKKPVPKGYEKLNRDYYEDLVR